MGLLKSALSWKDFNMKESREILHPLPSPNLLISLLPALQLNVTRTIWRGLKTKQQETRSKNKIEQEKLKENSLMIRFTLLIFPMANEDRIDR